MPQEPDPILERWNRALTVIRAAGFTLREEWIGGGGGLCEFGGKKYFFSDQSLSLFERIDQAEEAVREIENGLENRKESSWKTQ